MKKRLIALMVCLVMVMMPMLASCGGGSSDSGDSGDGGEAAMKVGLICLHDENSTYDLNFLSAFQESCDKMGVEAVIKKNVPEGQECYDEAMNLVDEGCTLIFSDSFGHQDFMLQAAKEAPEVQFVSCTGDKALVAGVDNYHNAFASIYEGRFLAGVAAGMKLNEIKDAGKLKGDAPDLNEDDKEHIMECVQEHISCEKQRNEEIANGDEDVLEEKTLTVSPYGGCYTLECEWCNSVVTDLELLLDECEE